jgi:diketogulonate reductase-like aldo/keto reductase
MLITRILTDKRVWSTRHTLDSPDGPAVGMRLNLDQLGLKYVDLALVHFPIGVDAKWNTSKATHDITEVSIQRLWPCNWDSFICRCGQLWKTF